MAVIVLLLVCGWISIVNAQPNTVTILPQGHQSACRGESISFNCISDGTDMTLFSPPIINESNPVTVFSSQSVPTCRVIPNLAAVILLVDPSTGSPLFTGTFTLYISDDQLEGQRTVFCQVAAADGMTATNETTFSVLGAPGPATPPVFQVTASSSEDGTQVAVNVSWDAPENAEEFMLQIQNADYTNTISSLKKSVTVLLPYGSYSATLCTINRCGEECLDPISFSTGPQPTIAPNDNSLLIVPAVVAGILGFLLILASIYGVIVTIIICKEKENARAVEAEEMK